MAARTRSRSPFTELLADMQNRRGGFRSGDVVRVILDGQLRGQGQLVSFMDTKGWLVSLESGEELRVPVSMLQKQDDIVVVSSESEGDNTRANKDVAVLEDKDIDAVIANVDALLKDGCPTFVSTVASAYKKRHGCTLKEATKQRPIDFFRLHPKHFAMVRSQAGGGKVCRLRDADCLVGIKEQTFTADALEKKAKAGRKGGKAGARALGGKGGGVRVGAGRPRGSGVFLPIHLAEHLCEAFPQACYPSYTFELDIAAILDTSEINPGMNAALIVHHLERSGDTATMLDHGALHYYHSLLLHLAKFDILLLPMQTEPDGNCLINAVCLSIWGIELFAAWLRSQVVWELTARKPFYSDTEILGREFPNILQEAAGIRSGCYSFLNAKVLAAVANILGRPIILLDSLESVEANRKQSLKADADVDRYAVFVPRLVTPITKYPVIVGWSGCNHGHFIAFAPVARFRRVSCIEDFPMPLIADAEDGANFRVPTLNNRLCMSAGDLCYIDFGVPSSPATSEPCWQEMLDAFIG